MDHPIHLAHDWWRVIRVKFLVVIGTNGVHSPLFPKGGACVLSVIRFQDGERRSAVNSAEARTLSTTPKCIDKRSKNWLDWKGTYIFFLYYTENPSIRFMFVTFQYYCRICWMSKLPRLKIKRHKIMMTGQFECAFVTGFRDKTRRICHIIIEKEDFEANYLY